MGDAQRRGEEALRPVRGGLRRVLGVHRRAGRPDRRLPRGDRSAREHHRHVLRRQRRLRRGQPGRHREREQVLQRLSRGPRAEPLDARPARIARTPTTTTRPAGRPRSRRPSRCSSATPTRAASPTRWSSRGRPGSPPAERCATSTTTPSTSSRRSWSASGMEFPEEVQGYAQTRAPRRLDEVHLRCRRPDPEGGPVLRDDGDPSPLAPGLARGGAARTPAGRRRRPTSPTTPGSSTTPTRTAPSSTTWRREHPDKVKELVNLWYVEAGKYDVLPLDNRSIAELVRDMPVADDPRGRRLPLLPRHLACPEFDARRDPRPLVQDPGQVELDDADAQGVLLANGARSAATRCSSRTGGSGTSTTSSASRPSSS